MRTNVLSMFTVVMFAISGCIEDAAQLTSPLSSSKGSKTSAELTLEKEVRSLSQVSKDIIVRNTVQGAVVAAAAGCGIALLLGGNADSCLKGAAIGAVAGGVAGNQIGKKTAKKNESIVNNKEIIKKLSGVNKRLNTVQGQLRSVVRAQNAEIGSLRRQLSSKQISQSSYNSRISAINSNRKNVSAGLSNAQKNMASQRAQLVSLEKKGGRSLASSKNAVSSTERRLASLRKSVSLSSVK